MNQHLIDSVVNAVLYEGYILYPYRASAKKNRQRFTFGRVYPEAYSRAQLGAEPCSMQTECLVEGFPDSATLEIAVRFLHPMLRDIGALAVPMQKMPAANNPDFFHVVPELVIDGTHHASWHEAVERSVPLPPLTIAELLNEPLDLHFHFPAVRLLDPLRDNSGLIAGVIMRERDAVQGTVEVCAEPVAPAVTKISVRITNQTPEPPGGFGDHDDLVMHTFASTHTILHVRDGAFYSMIDPPEAHAATAATCQNLGTWPILVGDEAAQQRDTLISSPIILYDYPQIAPESAGDLFDSGEINEILTLRIMTMTDDEKSEMRSVDAHARRILERTESLPSADLLRMHGVMHGATPRETENNNASLAEET